MIRPTAAPIIRLVLRDQRCAGPPAYRCRPDVRGRAPPGRPRYGVSGALWVGLHAHLLPGMGRGTAGHCLGCRGRTRQPGRRVAGRPRPSHPHPRHGPSTWSEAGGPVVGARSWPPGIGQGPGRHPRAAVCPGAGPNGGHAVPADAGAFARRDGRSYDRRDHPCAGPARPSRFGFEPPQLGSSSMWTTPDRGYLSKIERRSSTVSIEVPRIWEAPAWDWPSPTRWYGPLVAPGRSGPPPWGEPGWRYRGARVEGDRRAVKAQDAFDSCGDTSRRLRPPPLWIRSPIGINQFRCERRFLADSHVSVMLSSGWVRTMNGMARTGNTPVGATDRVGRGRRDAALVRVGKVTKSG